jgi:TNF receptor-associated factor 4
MVLKELAVRGTSSLFFHSTKRDRVVFVEDIPPELVCPACDDVFDDPHVAPCGHAVCHSCIATTAGRTGRCLSCAQVADPDDFVVDSGIAIRVGDARCFCRNAIGVEVLEDRTNRKLATDSGTGAVASKDAEAKREVFVRKDDFHETACSRTVPLRELEDHEAACDFQTLMCDLCDEDGDDEAANVSPGKDPKTSGGSDPASPSGERNAPAKKKTHPAPCGFACLRRDMPSHQAECGHRLVECPYGMKGKSCRWFGAARRARTKHAETCVAAPKPCPNKCGLWISAENLEKHKNTTCAMQEITCGAPDAEAGQGCPDGKHVSWCDSRCPSKITRVDLGKHRRELCEFARAVKCRLCRELVSLRSAGSHAAERCSRARRSCPNDCGTTVRLGDEALRVHVDEACPNAPAECPYTFLGCKPLNRLTRKTREEHLRHATGAHAELIRVGLVDAKRRSDAFREEVDDYRTSISAEAEKTRIETSAYLDRRLKQASDAADFARVEDEKTRNSLLAESLVLRAAMQDLSTTTASRMLEQIGRAHV